MKVNLDKNNSHRMDKDKEAKGKSEGEVRSAVCEHGV